MTPTQEKVQKLRHVLADSLIERDAEAKALVIGVLCRDNVLLVGPPGTAKSLIVDHLHHAVADATKFSVLLSKFTDPDEIFGPVSFTAMKEDRRCRNLANYAAEAHFCMLDEIWKASAAIPDAMLTFLNEKLVIDDGVRKPVPLISAAAASNEWPSEMEEMAAIFDRFLIRRTVNYVSPMSRRKLLFSKIVPPQPVITVDEIRAAWPEVAAVDWSDEAKETLDEILDELSGNGVMPGDRRLCKSVNVARAAAYLDGKDQVEPHHLETLAEVLWVTPDQAQTAGDIVVKIANPVGHKLNGMLSEIHEIVSATSTGQQADYMTALKQLDELQQKAEKMSEGNGRAKQLAEHAKTEKIKIQAKAMGIKEDMVESMLAAQ